MPTYVIERNMPGVGGLGDDAICAHLAHSNAIARDLDIQWVRSYVTADKVFCVFVAPSEQHVLDHASAAGMPADAVLAISRELDPHRDAA